MSAAPTLTLFTYTTKVEFGEERWNDRSLPDYFFDDEDAARADLLVVRDQVKADDEEPLSLYLEKVETVPMTAAAILALLNEGVGAIIQKHEVVEEIMPL